MPAPADQARGGHRRAHRSAPAIELLAAPPVVERVRRRGRPGEGSRRRGRPAAHRPRRPRRHRGCRDRDRAPPAGGAVFAPVGRRVGGGRAARPRGHQGRGLAADRRRPARGAVGRGARAPRRSRGGAALDRSGSRRPAPEPDGGDEARGACHGGGRAARVRTGRVLGAAVVGQRAGRPLRPPRARVPQGAVLPRRLDRVPHRRRRRGAPRRRPAGHRAGHRARRDRRRARAAGASRR